MLGDGEQDDSRSSRVGIGRVRWDEALSVRIRRGRVGAFFLSFGSSGGAGDFARGGA